MRKIFLFLFAAVLSIGTAMAEVVTITEYDCNLEYEVDGRALLITGDYLGDPFSLTLLSENDIDLTAESFVCDVQTLNIAEWSKYADRGTATVKVYPMGIGITATGLYDAVGDDPNTYDLVDLWATPKEAAGGGDIPYDMEFTVDMTGLEATSAPLLTFAASGQSDIQLGRAQLGTVVTYLECSWEEVDGAFPVDLANSYLTLADHGMLGQVLGGSVVPVIDETIGEAGAIVSATAVVYVAFEDMGTFKFTLNMTAGSSEEPGEPGEPEESATVSVQVWNAELSQQWGTLMVNGSMNGVAVHAEVPGFEFVPDTWDWFDYSNVLVEVGTWGESDYVGMAYGDATVELDQNTVTITGTMTASDGTSFVAYIQGSLQPADPMTSTTLTMEGLMKTEDGRYIALADENNNTIEIWGSGYSDYLKVTASFDETLEGYGSWKEVAGVETLVATLYDDYYTHVYYVTATASAQQMFTINSFDATYFIDPELGEVTFIGIAEEGGEFEITVGNSVEGQFAQGYWGETEIVATEITDFERDFFDDTYMLGGSFVDEENNIYEVWIPMAAPTPIYTRTVAQDQWGTICLPYASRIFTGATFYEVSSLDPAKGLWLDQLEEGAVLEAGKPYIFQAAATEISVTCTSATVDDPVGGANGLTGTFTDIAAAAGSVLVGNYIIAQNAVHVATAQNDLPANRAYISSTVPTTAQAEIPGRRRVCMGENAATGLDQIVAPEGQTIKAIVNGQLVIIRGGEMYNVQGQKL